MEEMTVTGLVALFPSTKEERDVFVEKLIDSVLAGCVNPLTVENQLAQIEMVVRRYRSDERVNEYIKRI